MRCSPTNPIKVWDSISNSKKIHLSALRTADILPTRIHNTKEKLVTSFNIALCERQLEFDDPYRGNPNNAMTGRHFPCE